MSCPTCGSAAPLVSRGFSARCAACGAERSILSAPAIGVAGRPTRALGTFLRVIGLVSLLATWGGGAVALWLQKAIFPSVAWLFWIDLALVLFGSVLALGLRWVGGRLVARGARIEGAVEVAAILAVTGRAAAGLTAREVARALELPEAQVDHALTSLVIAERARADVDDHRGVVYRAGPLELPAAGGGPRDD